MRACVLVPVVLMVLLLISPASAKGDPYIGISHTVNEDPAGLLIQVVPGAPADLSGLRSGDVITALNGVPFSGETATYVDQLRDALSGIAVGDVINVTIYRQSAELSLTEEGQALDAENPIVRFAELLETAEIGNMLVLRGSRYSTILEIPVTLGARPGTDGDPFPANSEMLCDVEDLHPGVRSLLDALSGNSGIMESNTDLYRRLDERASPDDGFKLSRVVYLLRDGLKGEAVTRAITDRIYQATEQGGVGYPGIQVVCADLLDIPGLYASAPILRTGHTADQHFDVLGLVLETADIYAREAFADFTPGELEFISSQRAELTEIFRREHYVDSDDSDTQRVKNNLELIRMAQRIDYEKLMMAQLTLAQLADKVYLEGLRADLIAEFAGRLEEDVLIERETSLGRMVICGTGHTWHQGEPPVLLIDLGGDDFYTTTAGSGTGVGQHVGVLLELGGDDAYESTQLFSQGSGSLGCGLLVDLTGHDQYVGVQWAQGCGFFGTGALLDLAGDDVYRGEEFCQAAAIFGSGILFDESGDDRYEGQMKCQAFGGSAATGLLIDVAGDDVRYCKGKYQTGYGDPGIFDAWGQGCAMGFRGISAGGIAGVIDLGGEDYNEAGNFSQGGGYYFGYGFFHDRGWEDDYYLGSRYNQGFCAHQAVGVFLEDGGDDEYETRQAVAQGLAWDECCTMFVDYSGDDVYRGGTGFSQGASAHNAVCVMWDRDGRDSYYYAPGQARAGGNDYHGGTSLSLFIDEGGAVDYYTCDRSGNDLLTGWPEHGFFADLQGTLDEALVDNGWLSLWIIPDENQP